MPTYTYRCASCMRNFDVSHSMSIKVPRIGWDYECKGNAQCRLTRVPVQTNIIRPPTQEELRERREGVSLERKMKEFVRLTKEDNKELVREIKEVRKDTEFIEKGE